MRRQPLANVVGQLRRLAAGPTPNSEGGDADLLQRFIASRDEDAFAALVQRHGPMVREVCRRLLGHEADGDDAFQAVFLVLARKASSLRRRQSLAAWLYGVAHRTAQRARRDAARRRIRHPPPVQAPVDPAQEAARRELFTALDEELFSLPEALRASLVLCYLEGRTRDEAARQLGQSLRTLDRRLHVGKERLRRKLSRRGLTFSAALLATGLAQSGAEAALSAGLVAGLVKGAASVHVRLGPAPATVSPAAVILTEGVLQAMLRTKLKWVGAFLLAVSLLGAALHTLRPTAPARDTTVDTFEPSPDVYALVLFEEREPQLLPNAARAAPADLGDASLYRRTQVVRLRSRALLRQALKEAKVASLPVVKQKADPVAWLEQHLRTSFLNDTGVLRVSLSEGNPEEKALLINAVVSAYLDQILAEEGRRKVQRLEAVQKVIQEHQKRLNHRRQDLQEYLVTHDLTVSTFAEGLKREDLAQLRKEIHRVHLASIQAQARLNYRKRRKGADENTMAKLDEELGVLQEQEKLLSQEAEPLIRVQERASVRAGDSATLLSLRNEIAIEEETVKDLIRDVNTLQVELSAGPRVRVLQAAEAPQKGK